jgi:hypothetical protein
MRLVLQSLRFGRGGLSRTTWTTAVIQNESLNPLVVSEHVLEQWQDHSVGKFVVIFLGDIVQLGYDVVKSGGDQTYLHWLLSSVKQVRIPLLVLVRVGGFGHGITSV